MIESIAFKQWKQDVAALLVFQWVLLLAVCCASLMWGVSTALNAMLVGLAVVIPNTALGAWVGVRLMLGKASGFGMLLGSFLKTGLAVVLIGASFFALQELGWVWQGFFAGLVSMVFAPVLFGMFQAN